MLSFSNNPEDVWTISDAVRGTQIFGGIGSGKSSGSAKNIAKSFLQNGFGGLVLCGKSDERANWERYAAETNRTSSLKIISEHNDYRFNFLQYENTRPNGGGKTRNIVNLFMAIHEMGEKGISKGEEAFWKNSLRRLLNRTIDLLKLANEPITMDNIYNVINSYPQDTDFYIKANSGYFKGEPKEYDEFINSGYCYYCLNKMAERELSNELQNTFEIVWNYWGRDLPNLAERTRSIIIESFLGLAEPFLTGMLRDLFTTTTNITPEITHDGHIIILDFPEKEYLELGVYAQSIFKLLWQQSVQRRDVNAKPIPVFLWVDEAQLFLNDKQDMLFQTTARSSKSCTVFISQNISNYYAVMGGAHPKEQADSLLGNLSTKIFHCNNDFPTNKWASDTIGQTLKSLGGISMHGGNAASGQGNTGFHTHKMLMNQVEPREFTTLKSGGKINNGEVDAIVTVAGKTWSNSKNFLNAMFLQDKR